MNQMEGCALQKKTSVGVFRFLIEEVFCRYRCVGQVTPDLEELDSDEAKEFLAKFRVQLAHTGGELDGPEAKNLTLR